LRKTKIKRQKNIMQALIGKNVSKEDTLALNRNIDSAINEKSNARAFGGDKTNASNQNPNFKEFDQLKEKAEKEVKKGKYGEKERINRMEKLKKMIKKKTLKIER